MDFKDDVRDLLNNAKYQASVATTGIPGWSANQGEFAFFSSGSDRRLYLRASTAWQLVAGFDPTLNPSALGTVNAGTGSTFSLIDHIHNVTFSAPVAIGTANDAGSGADLPRANHIHLGFLQAGSSQSFTATGTWTRPTGISRSFVRVWGAGGGGGEAGNTIGDGNVGVGGNASSFAGVITVTGNGGGGGGKGLNSGGEGAGGSGGSGTGGNTNLSGQAGSVGKGGEDLGGNGGGSPGGGGGGSGGLGGAGHSGDGDVGTVPGGGGGGGGGTGVTVGGGGGGGGGGYSEGFVTVTGNVTVTVGTGGAGGSGGGAGGDGGAGGSGLVIVYW